MTYHQLTSEERYMLSTLRAQGFNQKQIALIMDRSPSTISRELLRNRCQDGFYRVSKAISRTTGRRSRSRANSRFTSSQWAQVTQLIREDLSPEQVSGWLRRYTRIRISHETIYRYIWLDRYRGGSLHTHLRQHPKKKRKRYASYEARGRLAGKRHISQRPRSAHNRSRVGHWEGDTVMGSRDHHCIVTLVERKTGLTAIGKLSQRTKKLTAKRLIQLIQEQPRPVKTITLDNGTEFHDYKRVEQETGVKFYFANPYHSWERGTNENTNGLIRQYLPKGKSMAKLTQVQCEKIAAKLNTRPRKRLGFRSPEECYAI
jgi:IS30 family transposase